MVAWQTEESNQDSAKGFFARIQSLCQAEAEGSAEKQNCESLMAAETTAG